MDKAKNLKVLGGMFQNGRTKGKSYQHGGSFGSSWWRNSPQFVVRLADGKKPRDHAVHVTAIVVEGSPVIDEEYDGSPNTRSKSIVEGRLLRQSKMVKAA